MRVPAFNCRNGNQRGTRASLLDREPGTTAGGLASSCEPPTTKEKNLRGRRFKTRWCGFPMTNWLPLFGFSHARTPASREAELGRLRLENSFSKLALPLKKKFFFGNRELLRLLLANRDASFRSKRTRLRSLPPSRLSRFPPAPCGRDTPEDGKNPRLGALLGGPEFA